MIKGNVKIDRKNLISILQSCLVLILVILVALMMVEIGNLKGTAASSIMPGWCAEPRSGR